MEITRRDFLVKSGLAAGALLTQTMAGTQAHAAELPEVYFTGDLTVSGLLMALDTVKQHLTGRVAIKLHTGEPHGPNIIPRDMIKAVQDAIPNSTLVECNVLYGSPRQTNEGHRETLMTNGFTFSKVDIMDEEGDAPIPVPGGKWLKEVHVGSHMLDYDSMLVLTHFKGHAMGGFGGSLKNIAIGCASGKRGKAEVHGLTDPANPSRQWLTGEKFMELMADSGKATCSHFGKNIVFINVLRSMSVDCDCAGIHAARPTAPDLGILASADILAIDQASIDMVYALPEAQKKDLVERIESRKGLRQLSAMDELGMGSREYRLVTL